MRKEDGTQKTVIFSSKTNVNTFKEYEELKLSFSCFRCSDVLTTSVGVADDDNIGGFLDAWRE